MDYIVSNRIYNAKKNYFLFFLTYIFQDFDNRSKIFEELWKSAIIIDSIAKIELLVALFSDLNTNKHVAVTRVSTPHLELELQLLK